LHETVRTIHIIPGAEGIQGIEKGGVMDDSSLMSSYLPMIINEIEGSESYSIDQRYGRFKGKVKTPVRCLWPMGTECSCMITAYEKASPE
jgi:hypothetical protein